MILLPLALAVAPLCAQQDAFSPRRALLRDIDGDGRVDALLYGGGGKDECWMNRGSESLVEETLAAGLAGQNSRFALLEDLQGDGAVDLIRITTAGVVIVQVGDGTGSFDPPLDCGLGAVRGIRSLEARDLDGDGDLDLVGLAVDGGLRLFENTGELAFESMGWIPGEVPGSSISGSAGAVTLSSPSEHREREPRPTNGTRDDSAAPSTRGLGPAAAPPTDVHPRGSTAGLGASTPTAKAIADQASLGTPLLASSLPTLGLLYPLSMDWNVNADGNVGIGTIVNDPNTKLRVNGKAVLGRESHATGTYSAIGGGYLCEANGDMAVVSGGLANWAQGTYATVSGGEYNRAFGYLGTVGGGYRNTASGYASTACGGSNNVASGVRATVVGGFRNLASGDYSLAAGQYAEAIHDGSFVWAGRTSLLPGPSFTSTGPGQFLIEAEGGVGIGTAAPLAPLHLSNTSGALTSADLSLETVAVEDQDSILGLYSSTGGNYGSGIVLGEFDGGGLTNKWALVRRTSSTRDLVLTFGTDPAYNLNPTLFTFGDEGDLRIGSNPASELTLFDGVLFQEAGDLSISAAGRVILDSTVFTDASTGRVGIGTSSPSFTLHVNGSAGKPGGGSWSVASDARLKEDVAPLVGALERLMRLRGVTFRYIDPEAIGERPGTQTGMIAQEVAQVFPEWVEEGPDGYLRLSIHGFEALAVEALRELRQEKDAEVRRLEAQLAENREELLELRRHMDAFLPGRAPQAEVPSAE
ncbi:MAG TPA: hypothetical protein ENJ09_04025 [Planctomycetes bacterium]|nr:hypothetical protein [Planctomycetota bacterium]